MDKIYCVVVFKNIASKMIENLLRINVICWNKSFEEANNFILGNGGGIWDVQEGNEYALIEEVSHGYFSDINEMIWYSLNENYISEDGFSKVILNVCDRPKELNGICNFSMG